MNISRENTGDLTATIKIEIVPADYSETVEKQITDYRRKANIPGFRPGHVPAGMIRKMYGKALLADEVNRIVTKGLMDYIKEEELNILGNPIPTEEKNTMIDFDHQDSFTFFFDLGFTPEFEIPMNLEEKVTNYNIVVSDEMIENYIQENRKRFGKKIETTEEAEGEEKKEPEVEPAEMNAEFFEKMYPGMTFETEEAFREQVRKDAGISFTSETDKMLFNNLIDGLVQETQMVLPDSFLKRWLIETNEGKFNAEQIEEEYPKFVDSMKWQLIENKLIKENNIRVTDEEIRDYIRMYMFRQLNFGQLDPEMAQRYESLVDTLMENKEQVSKINDQLYNAKMMDYLKTAVKYTTRDISYEEFITIAADYHKKHNHDHDHHDHDHDHDHDHHDHTHTHTHTHTH